ncbi:MAG: hypothetical protein ACJAS6_001107 [Rickettsiales bacterium]|jgi:hypothetical protein
MEIELRLCILLVVVDLRPLTKIDQELRNYLRGFFVF